MIERQPRELERPVGAFVKEGLVVRRATRRIDSRRVAQIRHDDDPLDARYASDDSTDGREAVDFLSRVPIAIGAEEDARRDLAEAVDEAPHDGNRAGGGREPPPPPG